MWNIEKELVPLQVVKSEGNLNSIIQDEIYIDVKDVLTLIKQVEEETLVRPSNYMMVVRTDINGDVFNYNETGYISLQKQKFHFNLEINILALLGTQTY